jgi:hypothetical protein
MSFFIMKILRPYEIVWLAYLLTLIIKPQPEKMISPFAIFPLYPLPF